LRALSRSFASVGDFLDLHFGAVRPFYVFNVADAAISIGVVILLIRALLVRPEVAAAAGVCTQTAKYGPQRTFSPTVGRGEASRRSFSRVSASPAPIRSEF
jgi:hypothetical protein